MAAERTKSTALLLVIAVFVLGVALGALGMYLEGARVMAGHPAQPVRLTPAQRQSRTVDNLTKELGLTTDQQNQLRAILEQTGAGYKSVQDEEAPKIESVRQKGRDRIRAILTPDQLPKFEETLRRMDEERKKRAQGQN